VRSGLRIAVQKSLKRHIFGRDISPDCPDFGNLADSGKRGTVFRERVTFSRSGGVNGAQIGRILVGGNLRLRTGDLGSVKTGLFSDHIVHSAIGLEIGPPKGAKRCFFRARIIPISRNPGHLRGFRKNILSLFRELLSKVLPRGVIRGRIGPGFPGKRYGGIYPTVMVISMVISPDPRKKKSSLAGNA
jgi:hypothetical protein